MCLAEIPKYGIGAPHSQKPNKAIAVGVRSDGRARTSDSRRRMDWLAPATEGLR